MALTPQQRLEAALKRLAPAVRKTFDDAIAKAATAVDLAALADAIERKDAEAAVRLVEIKPEQLFQVTEAVRGVYIAGGMSSVDGLPLYIRATFGFGGNPRAVAQMQEITGHLITNVLADQRQAITAATQELIARVANTGIPARTAALEIVGTINRATGLREGGYLGLDVPRAEQAARVAKMLRDPKLLAGYWELDPVTGGKKWIDGYFTRDGKARYSTTDRRFDATVRKAIAAGRAVSDADATNITKHHRARLLKNRGDTIARTEALNGLRAGERAGFQQLVDSGAVADARVIREWIPTMDDRTRQDHMEMVGQKKLGMSTPFMFPDGSQAMFPGDGSLGAPARELILCRCAISYRLTAPKRKDA